MNLAQEDRSWGALSDLPGNPMMWVLILTEVDDTLTIAQYIPITFTFERAGEITIDVVISAPLQLTVDRALRAAGGN